MTDRLARGSLPWPELPASVQARPACRGSITVEAPIALGAAVDMITAENKRLNDASERACGEADRSCSAAAGRPAEADVTADRGRNRFH